MVSFLAKESVKKYMKCENCLTCLVYNSLVNSHEGKMQITDSPSAPFVILHIDHFGLILVSTDGYKHIFIIVDIHMVIRC